MSTAQARETQAKSKLAHATAERQKDKAKLDRTLDSLRMKSAEWESERAEHRRLAEHLQAPHDTTHRHDTRALPHPPFLLDPPGRGAQARPVAKAGEGHHHRVPEAHPHHDAARSARRRPPLALPEPDATPDAPVMSCPSAARPRGALLCRALAGLWRRERSGWGEGASSVRRVWAGATVIRCALDPASCRVCQSRDISGGALIEL